jgi:hypothetical protein
MKTTLSILLLFLFLLSACTPASSTPVNPASPSPVSVAGCLVTPHEYDRQDNPIPMGVLANIPGGPGLSLLWRDGSSLETWQTGTLFGRMKAHLAGSGNEQDNPAPLVFLGMGENSLTQLNVSLTGQVSLIKEFPRSVTVTGLTGIPKLPVIAYSTVEPLPDGSGLRSQMFLGDFQSIASASPILSIESGEPQIAQVVAIHRDVNNTPTGLWYTYAPWGIGGDSLTDPRAGLYLYDLASGKSLEFLSMGCNFSSLSVSQTWAAWESDGVLYAADLHNAGLISFSRLNGYDRGPVHANIGPGDGYVSWMEGKGSEFEGTLDTTLRVGTLEGILIGEYPLAAFIDPSGLGEGIVITPLGWMASENYNLVVAAYNASTDRAVLVSVDVNAGKISLLSEISVEGFAGFAYP